MKRFALISTIFTILCVSAFGQENTINRIPVVGKDINQEQLSTYNSGVWFSAELLGGYSAHLSGDNMGVTEVDVTVGYRFNEYIKLGIGVGVRYYIDQKDLRRHHSAWGMPIFLGARGNIIPGKYRKCVPYWGFEIGTSIRDGVMFRPTVGLHIGEPRQAFTIGVSYMGQNIASSNILGENKNSFTSFFCLRLGYEF